ncbi:MAG TPA: methyltransferase type 11 [Caulobacteraceae bacterium]|jgi:hypothetical protein|nr:methyltransferase type 11 [Caulobacteraceae bacterium]
MRKALLAAICLTALAGCGDRGLKISKHLDIDDDDDRALRVVTQLVCPDHQGDLTRVRTAPDGASCDYAGPRGSQVTLSLVKLKTGEDPESVLKPLENQLAALMPTAMAKLAKDNADSPQVEADRAQAIADKAQKAADDAEARAETASDRASDAAERAADRASDAADRAADKADDASDRADDAGDHRDSADVKMPGISVKSHGDNANVRLPGIRVDANDGGAHINIAGIHIDADGDKGRGKSGRVSINADNNNVSIRAEDHAAEIRAKHNGNGVRMTYIIANDEGDTAGWKTVGYEARGPAAGPVVVALVKSKDRHEDPIFRWAKDLVKKNVEP